MNFILVFLGGGFGSLSRYLISIHFSQTYIGTFFVNILGSFCIGILNGLFFYKVPHIPPQIKTFIIIGFLGGFTTFSSFQWEILNFILQKQSYLAILYLLVSIILGILSVLLGFYCISKFIQ